MSQDVRLFSPRKTGRGTLRRLTHIMGFHVAGCEAKVHGYLGIGARGPKRLRNPKEMARRLMAQRAQWRGGGGRCVGRERTSASHALHQTSTHSQF